MTPAHFTPVPLDKSWRLMNHGPTVLVSAIHGGITNVMAAAWACVLDYGQTPKVTVVLDKATFTRGLIEASGFFALQLPTRAMATLTVGVGTDSARDVPDKLAKHGVQIFTAPGSDLPLVEVCVGWLPAGWCRSRTTSRPTICSSGRWLAPGRMRACSVAGAGTSSPPPTICERSTTWPVGSFW
jgi:hypothetical protein